MTTKNRKAAASSMRARAKAFAQRVAPVYQLLEWKWTGGDACHVPNADEIEHKLNDLIDHIEKAGEQIYSAGLSVGISEHDKLIWTRIKFELIDSTYFLPTP